jgi:hypothetical protein
MKISAHEVHQLLMDHAATAAIHNMILMLVNDGANECLPKDASGALP